LRPTEFCQLLNSTPLGEVISESQLRRQRTRVGLRIGDGHSVDLLRYVAWLVHSRHEPKPKSPHRAPEGIDLAEAARGAASLAAYQEELSGHGQKLTSRQEAVIAALLVEPTYAAAARKAGISESTLYRWLQLPTFRDTYRRARRELVEGAVGRVQAGSGQAVETLLHITRQGRRDGDRVRAAVALLEFAARGLHEANLLHGEIPAADRAPMNVSDLVALLGNRLRQLESSDLPTAEKTRLTASLSDALLRALGVDVIEKRLEAVQAVLLHRKALERSSRSREKPR
jgi:transposase-like protein